MLDLIGMTLCCTNYRQKLRSKKNWFETLVSCMLLHLGGTTLTGLMLGQLPGWMMAGGLLPAVLLSWWLVFCCPFDAFWNFISANSTTAVELLTTLDILNAVHCITTWGVDKVYHNEFHVNAAEISQSYVACIFAGVFSSCGGAFLLLMFHGEKSPLFVIGNFEGTRSANNAFLLSLLYYTLINKVSFMNVDVQMSQHSARAVVGAVLIYLHLVRVLYPDSNVCQWISSQFLSFAQVRPVFVPTTKRETGSKKKHD